MNKTAIFLFVFLSLTVFGVSFSGLAQSYSEFSCSQLIDKYQSNDGKIKLHKSINNNFKFNFFQLVWGALVNPDDLFDWDDRYDYEKLQEYKLENLEIKKVMDARGCAGL